MTTKPNDATPINEEETVVTDHVKMTTKIAALAKRHPVATKITTLAALVLATSATTYAVTKAIENVADEHDSYEIDIVPAEIA